MGKQKGKYIFVTGGVSSSLGKGIAAASIGCLMEFRDYNVQLIKIDPYLNVDAGTMNPYQHGEVYVTDDGTETDLDLGNYSRFTHATMSCMNSITTGQIYSEVIQAERRGEYLGRTVQVIPHIIDAVKKRIYAVGQREETDITIIEVGGTVGDIESLPFLECIRQILYEQDLDQVCCVHLTLVPELTNKELKTKPTQHSVRELRSAGISPDFLLCRSRRHLHSDLKTKIERLCNIAQECVISANDASSTYEVPFGYMEQNLDIFILKKLALTVHKQSIEKVNKWKQVVNVNKQFDKDDEQIVRIAMAGKYVDLTDAYKSIDEALYHAGIKKRTKVLIHKIDSKEIFRKNKQMLSLLEQCHGVLVPGGFGERGVDGMIKTVEYARVNKIPYFGICMGMQIQVIEYARNMMGWKDAHSTECNPDTDHPVVSLLEQQEGVVNLGGTMRLGANNSKLSDFSIVHSCYARKYISERHRHRYEMSTKYIDDFKKAELLITGTTEDAILVECVEWKGHPWGVGVQFHPEFKSMPIEPHPLFLGFIQACIDRRNTHHTNNI